MSYCSSSCRSFTVSAVVLCLLPGPSPGGEVVSHRCADEPRPDPEGPSEHPATHREVVALRCGVQVRSTSGGRAIEIRDDGRLAIGSRARDDA